MGKIIKVVQIHYSKQASGSAAWRLHNAFRENGIESKLLLHIKSNVNDPDVSYAGIKSKIKARIDQKIQKIFLRKSLKRFGLFSYPILGTDLSKRPEVLWADVIYIHWPLMGFLNFESIESLVKLKKPVVIIMHDMWWITGGCHHSFDCRKYMQGCNNCPMFEGNKKHDLSYKESNKKQNLYSKYSNIYFTAPSKWLYDCAKKSILTSGKPIFHIPNTLGKSYYKPIDKLTARKILNIPDNQIVIAFGAVGVSSPYKGWPYLIEGLSILKERNYTNITALIFGSEYNKEIEDSVPFKSKFMGFLSDELSLAVIYNAANVLVAPSIAEALGYVIMESLSCGTPVVGFDNGGIPDLIIHKNNGYLAKFKDANDLANGIEYCINNQLTGHLDVQFSEKIVVSKHLNLLREVLK